jgi:hypothetical protein
MNLIDCTVGDSLHFGDDIRIQLTGRIDSLLYIFIDAKRSHALEGSDGFHASALCRGGHRAHVLAMCDHDEFAIGPVRVRVECVRVTLTGAQALRDVCLRIDAPMPFARTTLARVSLRQRRHVEGASCWS